ncbi:MAG: hypothetical protein V5A22_00960 [Salinivenus sp.]
MMTAPWHRHRPLVWGLGLGLLLVGCAAGDGGSDPSHLLFRGVGQEPGWVLEVRAESLHFAGDYGTSTLSVPRSAVAIDSTAGRTVYRADRLEVVVAPDACRDVMSGEAFSHTVTVTVDGDRYRGCGRVLR